MDWAASSRDVPAALSPAIIATIVAWPVVYTAILLVLCAGAAVYTHLRHKHGLAWRQWLPAQQFAPNRRDTTPYCGAAQCGGTAIARPSVEQEQHAGELLANTQDVVIVIGSGIAGLACAAALHKVGIPVLVLEREQGPRVEGAAITFWPNAFAVLELLGVAEGLRKTHPMMERVEICTHAGAVLRSFGLDECVGAPHEARVVRRAALLAALRSAVPEEALRYSCAVSAVRATPEGAEVELASGERLGCRAVVGADGVKSRLTSMLGLPPVRYAGEVYFRGLATFPNGVPEPTGTLRQIWSSGRGVRVGISSLSATECFWFTTLSCPEVANWTPQTPAQRKAECLNSVRDFAWHIQEAIRLTPAENISRNRIVDRVLTPGKAVGFGCITVAGDSMHPMTANLGQGGCIALEDGVKLAQALAAVGGLDAPPQTLADALRDYERERTARAAPVIKKSYTMGVMLQIQNPLFCMVRNWVVATFFPVHSFLAPAAYRCGPLVPLHCSSSETSSDYSSSDEFSLSPVRDSARADWSPVKPAAFQRI